MCACGCGRARKRHGGGVAFVVSVAGGRDDVDREAQALSFDVVRKCRTLLRSRAYTRPHLCSTSAGFVTETSKAPHHMGQKELTLS
jgi:hypothetical protein